jgi:hypothetical protein
VPKEKGVGVALITQGVTLKSVTLRDAQLHSASALEADRLLVYCNPLSRDPIFPRALVQLVNQ